jgi:hypothetical protein
MHVVE